MVNSILSIAQSFGDAIERSVVIKVSAAEWLFCNIATYDVAMFNHSRVQSMVDAYNFLRFSRKTGILNIMRSTISLPKTAYEKLLKKAQLAERVRVLVQKEYPDKDYKEFVLTSAQKRDLKRAREEYKKGNYITFNELKRELGIKNS